MFEALEEPEEEEEENEHLETDFSKMSDEEFWDHIIAENIDNTDLSEEELRETPIWAIEEALGIEHSGISLPKGNRGGFHLSKRKEVLTADEREERKERVNKELGID